MPPKTVIRSIFSTSIMATLLSACASEVVPTGTVSNPIAQTVPSSRAPAPAMHLSPSQPVQNLPSARPASCVRDVYFPNFPRQYQLPLQEIACQLQINNGLPANYVIPALQNARFNARAVTLMTPPPPSQKPSVPYPWWRYRDRFLHPDRINRGLQFWNAHSALLEQVSQKYGVPGPILMGILNIETGFGSFMGNFSVLNSNLSLALALPGRRRFFLHETAETLKLAQKLGVSPATLMGSEAGAMGMSQFLASSYLRYGIVWNDPPGGPLPNLWQSRADVLASTANFFLGHGWQPGQPVMARVAGSGGVDAAAFLHGKHPLGQLLAAGIQPEKPSSLPADTPVGLLRLQTAEGPTLFIAYPNFYAIMGYNPSVYYSATVWAYSQAIQRALNG
ncbi:lytic murein transglycosylase [Acidithiobacillus concretivorus]|uniref:Lytic murein transglycosylase n=1 Tax=Acidithiobacillus concretivorus TaxID=3063952 RepID=A0ABS5ZQB4_9PROT|nr:lytic murein transglycosylase [Acidithiobacillus concretivorus]MBU2738838.1 lytic murein transglycosylase [Acidithiobacillus concretivorus]